MTSTLEREITRHIVDEYLPDTTAEELTADYDLIATGVVTSLQLLRLIGWLGDRYDIPFGDLEISPNDFRSVAVIANLVSRHQPAKSPEPDARPSPVHDMSGGS